MASHGLSMDVRKTCKCGVEFLTTKINVLGLCPACVRERDLARSRKSRVLNATLDSEPDPIPRRRRCEEHDQSGPAYGFASLGDVYMQNDGRMVGKRLRKDLMQMPQGKRPRNVLEVKE